MLKIYMFKTFLKFIFAIALIYWLIHSGKLDLTLIKKSFETGPQWIIAFILILGQGFIGTLRYKLLLQTKAHNKIHFLKLLPLSYIGFFFSTVLPGAVTGDLIKLVYIKKLDHRFSKTFLITVTLFDRILGLTGLLFLSGISSLIYYGPITALSPKIAHLILLNFLLFAGAFLFWIIIIAPEKYHTRIIIIFKKLPVIGIKIASTFEEIFSLRENKRDIFNCLLLSILAQFLGILAFWIISSPFYSGHLPLQYAFTFIPVGFIAMAIPISPGGLGVGHVLFANLFSLVHIDNGASLFNLFYLCSFVHNFLGVIPYLIIGKKKSPTEVSI